MKTGVTLVALGLLAAGAIADDTADIDIFTDYQVGLWVLQGGATVSLVDTQYVRSNDRSMKITMPAGSEFRWKHGWEGQDISGVSALEFWIYAPNGGVNTMTLQARVLGNPRNLVNVSSYVTSWSGWTKVSIPFSAFGVAPNERLQLIWFRAPATQSIPTFWMEDVKLVKPSHAGQTSVSVNLANIVRPVTKRDFGIGTTAWDWTMSLPETIDLVKSAGITFANFPGGTMVDMYDWRTNRSTMTGEPCHVDTLQYLDMVGAINGEAMLAVNYGSGTVQDARDYVQFVNIQNNRNVMYWTIGNECYQPDQYDIRPAPYAHDADTYAQFFIQAYQQMKAVDPRIKIGFVGAFAEWDWPQRTTVINPRTGAPANGWGAVVLARLRQAGITPDYMDFHLYTVQPFTETDATTLQMSNRVHFQLSLVRTLLGDYMGASASNIKLNMTEGNSAWMPMSRQSVSMTNALYLADAWANCVQAGLETFVWWNLHNSANQDGNYDASLYGSAQFGDFGILARGEPVGVGPSLNTPYPTYYAFKQLKNFIRPGDTLLSVQSNNQHISAWASVNATGRVKLMLINKAKQSDFWVKMNVVGQTLPATATVYRYGLPQEQTTSNILTESLNLRTSLSSTQLNAVKVNRYSIVVVQL